MIIIIIVAENGNFNILNACNILAIWHGPIHKYESMNMNPWLRIHGYESWTRIHEYWIRIHEYESINMKNFYGIIEQAIAQNRLMKIHYFRAYLKKEEYFMVYIISNVILILYYIVFSTRLMSLYFRITKLILYAYKDIDW